MNEYIFYTPEGYTLAPIESVEIENCQMLGIAIGKDEIEAKNNLLEDDPWIIVAGFNPAKFYNRRLAR